ncbi:Spermatogenesis-defective protein 39 [Daphnia magna]|uniref:Spermatogenesis-defective protein 39 n=1 Tax=Daphnia magna TaxID=35525 RepID=A0A164U6E5_9CRUS|nr:Spermatogenesis-defective protein 39 [Daphnia magna]
MDKPEDEKYWSSSATKGFDFDSEENEHAGDIFGATPLQTAQLSKEVQQNIPHQPVVSRGETHRKLSNSLSSLSTCSNSSYKFNTSQPTKQCEVTCKLLSSTINDETMSSPKDVVRSIFLGMSYDLSCFKKLSDKKILLDEALKLGDGDVICAVLLFLQKSLHQMVLFPLLKERYVAAREYIAILEKQKCFKEAAILCGELQQTKEAVVHLYNSCFREGEQTILSSLEQIYKNELKNFKQIEVESEIIEEHILLLERQGPIAVTRARLPQSEIDDTRTSPFIGKAVTAQNLVGSSLLSTLQYCCRHNWDAPENLLASPIGLKKTFKLTERQFLWNAFIGRILMNQDPLPILLVKGMFGAPKISASLSIPRILEIASNLNGKPNLFDQLLLLVEKSEKRYQLAKKYQRHRIVIDVLISNKDRISLLQYRDSIDDQSEIDYINNTLRVSSTRWKN